MRKRNGRSLGGRVARYGDSASVQAVTRVNAEQTSNAIVPADPVVFDRGAETAAEVSMAGTADTAP